MHKEDLVDAIVDSIVNAIQKSGSKVDDLFSAGCFVQDFFNMQVAVNDVILRRILMHVQVEKIT